MHFIIDYFLPLNEERIKQGRKCNMDGDLNARGMGEDCYCKQTHTHTHTHTRRGQHGQLHLRAQESHWPLVLTEVCAQVGSSDSSVLAWRIPGTGAWWAAVYGVV